MITIIDVDVILQWSREIVEQKKADKVVFDNYYNHPEVKKALQEISNNLNNY